jgi:glycosyltransferase involved in cell wall biosynthesis
VRILWLGHFVPWPPKGGSLIRSYHLLREAAQGNEAALVCLNQRSLLPAGEKLDEARRQLSALCASVDVFPIPADDRPRARERILARSTLSGRTYDDVWFESAALAQCIRDVAGRFQPDVVHFDTVGLARYISLVREHPLVLNHHNIESQMMARRADLEESSAARLLLKLQARRLARLEERSAPAFRAHLTVSELDRARLLELAPSAHVEVIRNGVDLDYFHPVPPDRPVVPRSIIFAGGLSWYPNRKAVQWLLGEILPRLRARYPDLTVTIIGRNPPPEFLTAAERDPRLTFTGFVDDIRPYMAGAAVYACPIFDGGGTRLKILDTLAQQVPLVATGMAVEGVGVESGRHALLADDAEGFCAAIGRIFDDPGLGARMAAEGRRLVEERFGWKAIGEALRRTYREVTMRPEPPEPARS